MKRGFLTLYTAMLLTVTTPATAGVVAGTSFGTTFSTVSWSVVAVGSNQSATNSTYILNWSVSGGFAYNFFSLRNTGSANVQSMLMEVRQIRVGGSGPANEIDFEACLGGAWSTTLNSCDGNVALLGKASDLAISVSNLMLNPGDELSIRARTAVSGRNNFRSEIDVRVSTFDLRSPLVI
jgi:hypothetical protein